MKMKLFTVHLAAALLGLVLVGVALLVILQWGNSCEFSLFGQNREPNTALVLVIALVVGAILPMLLVWEFRWLKVIHKVRKEQSELTHRAMDLMTETQSLAGKDRDDSTQ
jgi:MFS superfamily sulfate permease-like transporter